MTAELTKTSADPYDVQILDERTIAFRQSKGGLLSATIDGVHYESVVITRVFPLSKPNQYLAVTTASDNKELGIIEDLDLLDVESREAIDAELRVRYLVPIITHVESIKQEPGLWTWLVSTDRGDLTLLMRNLHEHLQTVGPGRMMISDMNGRRCELRDVSLLDAHSQRQLKKVM